MGAETKDPDSCDAAAQVAEATTAAATADLPPEKRPRHSRDRSPGAGEPPGPPDEAALVAGATERVRALLDAQKDASHSFAHVLAVAEHAAAAAAREERLEPWQRTAVHLAALLHEVDDEKLFATEDYANARAVLAELRVDAGLAACVVEIVDLVSTRKNKQAAVPDGDAWKLIVRDADRIEAVGEVGIARCYVYNQKVRMPLFAPETPRPTTDEELWAVATPERFAAYRGESASMIDHYYDKLLHLDACGSGSPYLAERLRARRQVMVDFVLDFGRTGAVDVERLAALAQTHCPAKK